MTALESAIATYDWGFELRAGAPGLAGALLDRDGIAESVAMGDAILGADQPISLDTRFHVASLAKPVTAAVAVQLAGRGELDLGQPICSLIGPIQGVDPTTTVMDLLNHTSGLRDQWVLLDWAGWRGNDQIFTADAMRVIKAQQRPMFPAGTRCSYSNSGYTLAASVLEQITGLPLAKLANREIFEPLSMTRTYFASRPMTVDQQARAYRKCSGGTDGLIFEDFSPQLYVPGPTSLVTTTRDYAKFLMALSDEGELKDVSRAMREPAEANKPARYSLGLFLDVWGEDPVFFHPGSDFGFSAFAALLPGTARGVILLSNIADAPLTTVARAALGTGISTSTGDTFPAIPESLPGIYSNEQLEFREFAVAPTGHLVNRGPQDVQLLRTGPLSFLTPGGERLVFTLDGSWHLRSHSPLATELWRQVAIERPEEPPSQLTGVYVSDETDSFFRVEAGDQAISVSLPKRAPLEMKAIKVGLFYAEGTWLRVVSQSQEGVQLELSARRCTGVRYHKREFVVG